MKPYLLVWCLAISCSLAAQTEPLVKKSDFLSMYLSVALQPGSVHKEQIIRKWGKDIMLFAESGMTEQMKANLQTIIDKVNPLLGNVKIRWVNEKGDANVLIKFDTLRPTDYFVSWSSTGTIYKGTININKSTEFNTNEQNGRLANSLLRMLGYFSFKKVDNKSPYKKCMMAFWQNDFSDTDEEILKLHYSNEIKPGMTESELNSYLKKLNR